MLGIDKRGQARVAEEVKLAVLLDQVAAVENERDSKATTEGGKEGGSDGNGGKGVRLDEDRLLGGGNGSNNGHRGASTGREMD
jgi:hypothetical protein